MKIYQMIKPSLFHLANIMKTTVFDKENIYNEKLQNLIMELKKVCTMEKLPMFIAVCVKNDENETVYKKDAVSANTIDLKLTKDYIPNLINATLGFDTVLPQDIPSIEFE